MTKNVCILNMQLSTSAVASLNSCQISFSQGKNFFFVPICGAETQFLIRVIIFFLTIEAELTSVFNSV